MAELIQGKWLSADAKQKVLESKLVALRNVVLNKSVTGGSATVTTEVTAAATTDTPITALTALGIYVGAVSGAVDPLKVQIRAAGTDNGVDDGSGDEIYGVLTEDTGAYTLTFKKADGSGFSFGTSTPVDFYFVEVYNEYSKPVNAHLLGSIGGVIDAVTADSIQGHIDDTADAHDASAISFVASGLLNTDADDAQEAIADLDAALGNIAAVDPTNYTASPDTNVAAHLDGIDTTLGTIFSALSSAGFAKEAVVAATAAALPACTYTNGTLGVGAKLTADANGPLPSIDGISLSLNDRVLVKDQTAAHNGIYKVTALGDGGNPFELTRTTDLDQAAEFIRGVMVSIKSGTINARRQYFLADPVATVGTSAVTWSSVTVESLTIAESKFKLVKTEGDSFYVSFQLTTPTANRLVKIPDRDVDLEWVTKPIVQILTLSAGDITAKYKDLANIIKSPGIHTVSVHPVGGIEQSYGDNWTAANDGSGGVGRITWDTLGLDGILEENDKLIVKYVMVAS